MKSRISMILLFAQIILLTVISTGGLWAEDTQMLLDLEGNWKFKTGDNTHWSDPAFNDEKWSEIYVPSAWEKEGYEGYDGYAWYRKHITVSEHWLSKDLLLDLGRIDDVDEVFVNGQSIGSTGSFPPEYSSAYYVHRRYLVPSGLLQSGDENVIAVRVYDDQQAGGITDGDVGLYERFNVFHADVALPAMWKFKTGDNLEWKELTCDDRNWKNIHVPAYWETQGFKDYDGYAWYRVTFSVPASYEDRDLLMLVGKIDDYDEVYLNGERIGRTGRMPKKEKHYNNTDEYLQLRAYAIPSGLLQSGKENILAVRVYDCWQGGGIYDGPIGIVTREHYIKYKRTHRNFSGWFWDLFNDFFN